MKKLQDLTKEELDEMTDEDIAQMEWENGGSGILPWGPAARVLNTRKVITMYLDEDGYGYHIGERKTGVDDGYTVPYDFSLHEKLKGIHSDSQEVRKETAKFISGLLNK